MDIKLPHLQLRDFLSQDEHAALLDYILSNPAKFRAATVRSGNDSIVNAERRVASVCRDLGPLSARLHQRFLDSLPALMAELGLRGAPPTTVELELAAHGDGAFYAVHRDIPIGDARKRRSDETDRVLSSVYYLHSEPKGYSGGELRLYQLDDSAAFVEIQPLQNSLVVFHSWVPHEVRPVSVPSGAFHNYRFAINCWFRRRLDA